MDSRGPFDDGLTSSSISSPSFLVHRLRLHQTMARPASPAPTRPKSASLAAPPTALSGPNSTSTNTATIATTIANFTAGPSLRAEAFGDLLEHRLQRGVVRG